MESRWLCGRMLLANGGDGGAVLRLAKQLEREHLVPAGRVWALLLRAGAAPAEQKPELLKQAIAAGDAAGTGLCAAFARWRLGGDERTRAEEWMRSEGIVDPAAMANVVAPGFD